MPTHLKVILFTDREDSSFLASTVGDAVRARINHWQEQLTREVAAEARGQVVKFTGDGHLITFESAYEAVRAGLRLQDRIADHNSTHSSEQFQIRIGMDVGDVEVDGFGDVRGHAADMAKRVEDSGRGVVAPVLFTERLRGLLPPGSVEFKRLKSEVLKGSDEQTILYQALGCLAETSNAFRNPFVVGGPIVSPGDFFGREHQINFAATRLRTMQSISITGERRIGKTSLLNYLLNSAPEWLGGAYRGARLDLLHPALRTLPGVLSEMQRQLGLANPASTLEGFTERMAALHAEGVRPILAFDEFEVFVRLRDEFSLDFCETLRAIASARQVVLVTASRISLGQMHEKGALVSPLHNIMGTQNLGPWTESEARGFVTQPRHGVHFSPEQIEAILDRGGGHPLRLQTFAWHAAQAAFEGRGDWERVWQEAQHEAIELIGNSA